MISKSQMMRELCSDTCRCGNEKQAGHSICRGCWDLLPQEMRGTLYRKFGQGYEEAYTAALEYLAAEHGEGLTA